MSDESIDAQDGDGLSAASGTIKCRTHRQITDLKWPDAMAEAGMIGTNFPEIAEHLGNQLLSCTWSADDLTSDEGTWQSRAMIALVARLGPRNELEGMLATQAVSVHNAAMECLRRAMNFHASMKTSDVYLKHAEKLCQIFVKQSEVMSGDKRSSYSKSPDE